ncbi:MAG: glycerol-3-phosphate dehydrogenase/oxidase [Cyclobacteriaceae bacterium]|nr:glycerol-3-phosphate dehydrogenase/oxidase [Cyclobacteriaceae bacterium]
MSTRYYDLIVIGGGITGAGIALDAALRGLRVALFEKHDFAFGTSSRSTKLIHGGLRYLKQLEFGLVKEVGSERAIVHKLAPQLTVAEKMLLPLNEGRGLGSFLTSFGLRLYDWLAGVKPEDQRRMLTRNQTLKAEPLLKPDDIKGSGLYAEYRTDDARLTIEIIKSAAYYGADILNYVTVTAFDYENEHVKSVALKDELTGNVIHVRAAAVVNATGPWVDTLRDFDKSKFGKRLHLTKGVHIVFPQEKLPIKQALYFDVPDGRMIFAIPRGRTTYVGTTDTDYTGNIEDVHTTREDARYLVNALNDSFPTVKLSINDIESSWAGLRPLIHEEGKSASELSRKDEIFISHSGLISIAGGKLTGYRKMAERVVDLVIRKYFEEKPLKKCYTDKVQLSGSEFENAKDVTEYQKRIERQLQPYGLETFASYLVANYGRNTNLILDHLSKQQGAKDDLALARAELWYGIHHEMVISPLDFFVRRTGMLFFHVSRLKTLREAILSDFQQAFGWNEQQLAVQREALEQAVAAATLKNS